MVVSVLRHEYLVSRENEVILVFKTDEISAFAQKRRVKGKSVNRYCYDFQMMLTYMVADIITIRLILFASNGIREKHHATLALESQCTAFPDMVGQKSRFVV